MWNYWHDGLGWGDWTLMIAMMGAFWGLLAWGIVTVLRGTSNARGEHHEPRREDPEQLLARRFAAGEIDEHEYRDRLDTLTGQQAPTRVSR